VIARRAFIYGIALGLFSPPLALEAQPAGKVYRIGMLERTSPAINPTSTPSGKGCEISGTSRGRTS
jgi:hypothetical protein